MSGAHIIFEDNGDLYYHFKSYISPEKMNKRYSLHYKAFQVQNSFSLEDLNIPETLFGKTQLNGKEVTWTQLEKHSFQGLTNKFFHTLDAMLYVITFKTYNIGPFGYSKYTSAKPLIITANP